MVLGQLLYCFLVLLDASLFQFKVGWLPLNLGHERIFNVFSANVGVLLVANLRANFLAYVTNFSTVSHHVKLGLFGTLSCYKLWNFKYNMYNPTRDDNLVVTSLAGGQKATTFRQIQLLRVVIMAPLQHHDVGRQLRATMAKIAKPLPMSASGCYQSTTEETE